MLERGFLAFNQFKASLSHEPRHVRAYLSAVDEVFGILAQAVQSHDAAERLVREAWDRWAPPGDGATG